MVNCSPPVVTASLKKSHSGSFDDLFWVSTEAGFPPWGYWDVTLPAMPPHQGTWLPGVQEWGTAGSTLSLGTGFVSS